MKTIRIIDAAFVHRWTVVIALSFIICHLSFTTAGAQSFTQRIQQTKKGEGTVTIHQSKEIDELVNAPAPAPAKKTATTAQPRTTEKPAAATAPTGQKPTVASAKHEKDTTETAQPNQLHGTRKVTGYRVQAFAGGNKRADRQKAEQTANAIRQLFPGEAVYTHFYNPRWICRVGNYPTYEEARRMLTELRNLGYSSATIVKGQITVPY